MKIYVSATPQAKCNQVTQIDEDHFQVKTTAIAHQGQANQAIIKLLAKHLKLRASNLIIVQGEKSREKIIQILSDK